MATDPLRLNTHYVHGVLLQVYACGVLITGPSGIGKSQLALELISRCHRLVADDGIELQVTADGKLLGQAPDGFGGLLAVRGLGVLNIVQLYGPQAVSTRQRLDLHIVLSAQPQLLNEAHLLDGLSQRSEIAGCSLPTLYWTPQQPLAVLIECAVRRLQHPDHNVLAQLEPLLHVDPR